jgi:hypothetical protein
MSSELTEKKFAVMHLVPQVIKAQRATAGDWIVMDGFKGVIPLMGIGQSIAVSLQEASFTYGVMTITPTCTTTTTSIAVTSATATRVPPYYLLTAGGEIVEVISETTPAAATSTLTVRRGCLGTTASATGLAASNVVGIMNILFLGSNNVGPEMIMVLPLPNDPGAGIFA